MSTSEAHVEPAGPLSKLGPVALALWLQGATRSLAANLASVGIPALLLKGPDLQQRLYGSPAIYASGDVDILIRAKDRRRAFEFLERDGWLFDEANGFLWLVSRAASFRRESVCVDLHWGLHAAHLPSLTLRTLERELWRGAFVGESGLREPRPEPLTVYLAVHAAGHAYERAAWTENARRAAKLVEDWSEVERIARESRVTSVVRTVLDSESPSREGPLLDGLWGSLLWSGTWIMRGHFLSPERRQQLKESLRGLGGGGWVGNRVTFAGLELDVLPGVFHPRGISEEVLELALSKLPEGKCCMVDVGTGSGVIALAAASARPDAVVIGTDISPVAIRCARANARRLGIRNAHFVQGGLLDGLPPSATGRVDVMSANLPYVPATYARDAQWQEPLSTVEGPGIDGLDLVRDLVRQSDRFLRTNGWLVTQVSDWQWEPLRAELAALGMQRFIPPSERRPSRAVVGAVSRGGGGHG